MVSMGVILKKLALENHLAVLVSSSLLFFLEARAGVISKLFEVFSVNSLLRGKLSTAP
jgi:hypothetical protein